MLKSSLYLVTDHPFDFYFLFPRRLITAVDSSCVLPPTTPPIRLTERLQMSMSLSSGTLTLPSSIRTPTGSPYLTVTLSVRFQLVKNHEAVRPLVLLLIHTYYAGALVQRIRATDADGGPITYELSAASGDGSQVFYLLPSNGEIRTLKSLKDIQQNAYVVRQLLSLYPKHL